MASASLPRQHSAIVADDDGILREILREILAALDLNVYSAVNGIEALKMADDIDADLFILDINMPRMNGLIACKNIRERHRYRKTPVVVLSAYSDEVNRTTADNVGATAFLTKPYIPNELLKLVLVLLPLDHVARILADPRVAENLRRRQAGERVEKFPGKAQVITDKLYSY